MFSIIVPLFNKEGSIAVTLNSVLSQSFDHFEVIIINDGSTDRSLQIVQSFRDPRLTIISQENKGVSKARNYAIKNAEREFICFLDADDSWEPDYLKEMSDLINRYRECSVFTSAYRVIGQSRNTIKCNMLPEGIIDDFFEARVKHHIMRTSAITVKKKVLEEIGGFPEDMFGGEDDYTWAKIAIKYKIAFTPKVLANYDNRSSTFNQRRGKMDMCRESWLDLYETDNFYRNEFIANKAITAGIRYAYGAPQTKSITIEKHTRYTTLYKEKWWYLYLLNRLPYSAIFLLKVVRPLYKTAKFWLARRKNSIKGLIRNGDR